MARYDDRINKLLGDLMVVERNRNPRNTDGVKARKGAEQHFDKDEPEDEDNEDEDNEDLKENIEGIGLGGMMGMGGTGIKHAPPGWKFADEDENEPADKTGHLSDRQLLALVKKKGTAGPALIKRAGSELRKDKSISSETRDALARDAYASWGNADKKKKR
jgi:hypothetical protein|tara:strand:+ start:2339 stop:2821 length:483 start_codon:yes stop_codon:yes gene_type:complete